MCADHGIVYLYNTDDIQYVRRIDLIKDISCMEWPVDTCLMIGFSTGLVYNIM